MIQKTTDGRPFVAGAGALATVGRDADGVATAGLAGAGAGGATAGGAFLAAGGGAGVG